MPDRPQKITFAEMRDMGVRGLLVDCSDYKCSHLITMSGDRWPDDMRLSDLQPRFVCKACGKRGADVRPDFNWNGTPVAAMGYRWQPQKRPRRLGVSGDLGRQGRWRCLDLAEGPSDCNPSRNSKRRSVRFRTFAELFLPRTVGPAPHDAGAIISARSPASVVVVSTPPEHRNWPTRGLQRLNFLNRPKVRTVDCRRVDIVPKDVSCR